MASSNLKSTKVHKSYVTHFSSVTVAIVLTSTDEGNVVLFNLFTSSVVHKSTYCRCQVLRN